MFPFIGVLLLSPLLVAIFASSTILGEETLLTVVTGSTLFIYSMVFPGILILQVVEAAFFLIGILLVELNNFGYFVFLLTIFTIFTIPAISPGFAIVCKTVAIIGLISGVTQRFNKLPKLLRKAIGLFSKLI